MKEDLVQNTISTDNKARQHCLRCIHQEPRRRSIYDDAYGRYPVYVGTPNSVRCCSIHRLRMIHTCSRQNMPGADG